MKTIYEAFDGKTFDNPSDCTEYEIKQMNDTLKLYGVPGGNGERVYPLAANVGIVRFLYQLASASITETLS